MEAVRFHKSINFIFEGNTGEIYKRKVSLTYQQYLQNVQRNVEGKSADPDIAYLTLYYSRQGSVLEQGDTIAFGDNSSELSHHVEVVPNVNVEIGEILNAQFISNRVDNKRYTYKYRKFNQSHIINFVMKKSFSSTEGAYLRRTYIAPFGSWNFEAKISINNINHGIWFIPKGTADPNFVLAQDNFPISRTVLANKTTISFSIEPLTAWWDVEYTLYFIT